jgi:hypothetical protein
VGAVQDLWPLHRGLAGQAELEAAVAWEA